MKFTFTPGSRPLAGYTIKRAIDKGGFGEVYYAVSDAGKEVALKLLQQNMDIELRGVRQCINLKHPNLVHLFDILQDADGDHWIVMEYISGRSLEHVLAANPQGLSPQETASWLDGIAAGLAFLHDRGIVHRDIKPANIFRENDIVRIGDVGLSKFITASRRNAQSQSVGTVYYMAPEVAHGNYGREVDIYSLAIVLYEMLTGRIPFDGESTAEILMKHLTEQPDLSPLPAALRPVFARALEKDPMKRTPDVLQLASDFSRAVRGEQVALDLPENSFAGTRTLNETLPPESRNPHEVRQQRRQEHLRLIAERQQQAQNEAERRRRRKEARKATEKLRKADRKARKAIERYRNRTGTVLAGGAAATGQFSTDSHEEDEDRYAWLHTLLRVGAVVAIVLALVAPGLLGRILPVMFRVGMFAALGYGGYWVVRQLLGSGKRSHRMVHQPPGGNQQTVGDLPAAAAVPPALPVRYHASDPAQNLHLGPETPRKVKVRQRLTDLTGALTVAVPATGLITLGLWQLTPFLQTPAEIGLFGGSTLLASWLLLSISLLREGHGEDASSTRLWQLAAGLLAGAGAWWLDTALLADIPGHLFDNPHGLFDRVGSHSLLDAASQPNLTGYLVFFGGLFALRRWWRHGDPFRKRRFRIISLLLTAMLAYGITSVWAFPHLWGTMLAAAVSSVIQLSSPWISRSERLARMGATENVV